MSAAVTAKPLRAFNSCTGFAITRLYNHATFIPVQRHRCACSSQHSLFISRPPSKSRVIWSTNMNNSSFFSICFTLSLEPAPVSLRQLHPCLSISDSPLHTPVTSYSYSHHLQLFHSFTSSLKPTCFTNPSHRRLLVLFLIMTALCSRCGHYIFAKIYLNNREKTC